MKDSLVALAILSGLLWLSISLNSGIYHGLVIQGCIEAKLSVSDCVNYGIVADKQMQL